MTPPGHWNLIAQNVAKEKSFHSSRRHGCFALLNIALADAAIVAWDAKFNI